MAGKSSTERMMLRCCGKDFHLAGDNYWRESACTIHTYTTYVRSMPMPTADCRLPTADGVAHTPNTNTTPNRRLEVSTITIISTPTFHTLRAPAP